MPASSINEPVAVQQTEGNQLAEIQRIVQEGSPRLVARDGHQVELPNTVRQLLLKIVKSLQVGKAVSIIADQQDLTTQRAANILGVSRPFLVRLLEEDQIAFHMVGAHRRIYLQDLLEYKHRRDSARHEALDRMAKVDVEAGTYDKTVLPEGAEEA